MHPSLDGLRDLPCMITPDTSARLGSSCEPTPSCAASSCLPARCHLACGEFTRGPVALHLLSLTLQAILASGENPFLPWLLVDVRVLAHAHCIAIQELKPVHVILI